MPAARRGPLAPRARGHRTSSPGADATPEAAAPVRGGRGVNRIEAGEPVRSIPWSTREQHCRTFRRLQRVAMVGPPARSWGSGRRVHTRRRASRSGPGFQYVSNTSSRLFCAGTCCRRAPRVVQVVMVRDHRVPVVRWRRRDGGWRWSRSLIVVNSLRTARRKAARRRCSVRRVLQPSGTISASAWRPRHHPGIPLVIGASERESVRSHRRGAAARRCRQQAGDLRLSQKWSTDAGVGGTGMEPTSNRWIAVARGA